MTLWAQLGADSREPLQFAALPSTTPCTSCTPPGLPACPRARSCTDHGGVLLDPLKLHHLHHDLRPGTGPGSSGSPRPAGSCGTTYVRTAHLGLDRHVRRRSRVPVAVASVDTRRAGENSLLSSAPVPRSTSAAAQRPQIPSRATTYPASDSLGRPARRYPPKAITWASRPRRGRTDHLSQRRQRRVHCLRGRARQFTPSSPARSPCRCLGVSVEAFDLDGRSVIDEDGELVVTAPMPSMPQVSGETPTGGVTTTHTSPGTRASGHMETSSGSRVAEHA